jgi:endonuclease YncB( thermonuclease family)
MSRIHIYQAQIVEVIDGDTFDLMIVGSECSRNSECDFTVSMHLRRGRRRERIFE